jgi:hypothetical protein
MGPDEFLIGRFVTSLDDFETVEEHVAIWGNYRERGLAYSNCYAPPEIELVSVNGMGRGVCPMDLWNLALEMDYTLEVYEDDYCE